MGKFFEVSNCWFTSLRFICVSKRHDVQLLGRPLSSWDVKCTVQYIIFSCFSRQWSGKGVNTVFFVCLLCPVWIIYEQVMIAALDCSRDDLALVRFHRSSSHTQRLQKPLLTLSQPFLVYSTPSAKVKIWFLFGQMVLLCLYFGKTICWELELEGVANERRSMLQVLAELGLHLWSSTAFSLRIYLPS